ncbi:type I 3-dehydroquinate dehydratase [Streptococcus devriesei]|uniref:type I 3-dehydroquinate dehydratase n=1 Tax=Streptococcus devriesei TaxID=231233 RepID=UPI00041F67D3|nr:type I 3-dehydroquinate dehydratase [Streptococcus devriesei]
MTKTVTVGNVTLGEGRPKILVPIVGKTESEILTTAEQFRDLDCDIIEWRVDFYDQAQSPADVASLSHKVKAAVQKPLLVTFRSKKEGGELEISDDLYFDIYKEVLLSGAADLLDVELFMPETHVQETIDLAHRQNVKVIMCNHDFDGTPSQQEIVRRLSLMEERRADICKIAVMPHSNSDVLTLLEATSEMKAKATRPLITMSMGALGMVSRVSGELFGSAATFGAAAKASAPGQVPVAVLRGMLETLKLN